MSSMSKKTILLVAGGTGGHFFPAIATGKVLSQMGYDIHMVTDKRCEKYIHKIDYIKFKIIDLYLKFSSIIGKIKAPLQILRAVIQSIYYVWYLKPSVVIGFGGYPSFPSLLAAKLLGIPIIIHEQNAFLGKSNRFFAKYARLIALSYSGDNRINNNYKNKVIHVGDIIRTEFISQLKTQEALPSSTNLPLRVFVFGGSQGAKIFSSAIPEAIKIAQSIDNNFTCKIIQQARLDDIILLQKTYQDLKIECEIAEFYHDIFSIYQKSNLVIARAGASTIGELSAFGLPVIMVPYPHAAENHQFYNAKSVEDLGGGWCITESPDLANNIAQYLIMLNNDRQLLKTASARIKTRKINGAQALADTVNKIINE